MRYFGGRIRRSSSCYELVFEIELLAAVSDDLAHPVT